MSCELGIVRGSILVSVAYQDPKISCDAFSSSGLLEHCVKKTLWCTLSNRHFGWLMNHAWPRELEMTNFIFCLFSLTTGSMVVLPILSISFSSGRGTSMANGMSCLMYSATFSVRDGVGRCPPSLNDASCDLSVLLGVNSYVLSGSKFLWKFGQEHFQQNWKVEILDAVLLSNKAR
jgi:hypothetical protein